jgi:hypothetical protein
MSFADFFLPFFAAGPASAATRKGVRCALVRPPPEIHGGGRFLLRRRDFVPAYLKAYDEGRLQDKVDEALSHLGPSCRCANSLRG